jgi:DNA-binding IclR family transcriptional regulator
VRVHLDANEVSELVARYQAGATVYDLAELFNIHRDRVSRLLETAGVARRFHETVLVDLESAAKLEAKA